jgi:bifunctional UDP-N-acetylglucosamine pyrophosphorylase/glucosamine-1-phosphate N-acetyltransferase
MEHRSNHAGVTDFFMQGTNITKRRGVCAVIPAAGRGSRLGGDVPKLLLPLTSMQTVWDVLYEKLGQKVRHVVVILHPSAVARFETHLTGRRPENVNVSYALQETPRGMGDAIFCGHSTWREFTDILVLWGDQPYVSASTIEKTLLLHHSAQPPALSLPLCRQPAPYVEYIVDNADRIVRVLETREGDACRPGGFSDVGVFCLSTEGIAENWKAYLQQSPRGTQTGEVNFLPFLPYLSTACGWHTQHFEIEDTRESRGINTPEDLAFFQKLMES